MTAPAVTVHRSTPLAVAAQKMEHLRIHRLVVVDDRHESAPVGVLSLTDIVHAIAEGTEVPPVAPVVEASDA
jgi:CBS domain-containing protein